MDEANKKVLWCSVWLAISAASGVVAAVTPLQIFTIPAIVFLIVWVICMADWKINMPPTTPPEGATDGK